MKVDQPGKNTTLYYDFHSYVGHTIEACRNLRKEIHNLIRKGYLKEFQPWLTPMVTDKPSISADQHTVNKEALCLVQFVQRIQFIYAGLACGGVSTVDEE